MKITLLGFLGIAFLLIIFLTTSCNRYIDNVTTEKKVPWLQGSIIYYPDSNIIIYKSNLRYSRDREILKPKSFYAKLPKGLVWCTVSGAESFKFYYLHKQAIAVNINIDDNAPLYDTTYIPNQSEITRFIETNYPSNDKYDLSKIDYKVERKHLIIKKGAATILLYNITPKNYSKFTDYLKEFKFLNDPAE